MHTVFSDYIRNLVKLRNTLKEYVLFYKMNEQVQFQYVIEA